MAHSSRPAAETVQPAFDVLVEAAHLRAAALHGEDHLRPARGEDAPAVGAAGLHDHGPALRAARDGQRAARLDPAALVIGVVDLGRVGQDPGRLVVDEGVSVPAVPQRETRLQHLVRPVIALLARRQLVHAGVLRLQIGGGGHHVPGHPPLAHHVQRAEPAGEVVGGVEGGGQRSPQAEMPGDGRHHRQHDRGVEEADLPAAADVGVEAAAMHIVQAEQVGEEAAVELGGLQHAGDVLVARRVEDVVQRRFRVAPAAGVQRGGPGLQVGDQVHLALGHATSCADDPPDRRAETSGRPCPLPGVRPGCGP